MGSIYWNIREIPIPAEAKLNHYNNEVSVYYKDGAGRRRHTVIGRAVSETHMHPNQNFKHYYPEIWAEISGQRKTPEVLHAGLYAMTIDCGWQTGLYELLHQCFGPQHANLLMDFAMYSLRARGSAAVSYQSFMEEQMSFSLKSLSDAQLDDFFRSGITENQLESFKAAWAAKCTQDGIKSVWLCIGGGSMQDGSNEEGFSYLWAVNAADYMPVTWCVNRGGRPDAKAFNEVINSLAAAGIQVEGVIAGSSFADLQLLELIETLGLKYVLKLGSSLAGFQSMLQLHAADVFWRVENVLTNSRKGIFGITDHAGIFDSSKKENCIGLYYAALKGSDNSLHLINKVLHEQARIQAALEQGQEDVSVSENVRLYLRVDNTAGGRAAVNFNYEAWQAAMAQQGFFALASSDEMSAEELYALYQAREPAAKLFSALRAQPAGGTVGIQSSEELQARFCAAFISAVIRTQALQACRAVEQTEVDAMVKKLDRVQLRLGLNEMYQPVFNLSPLLKDFLGRFGFKEKYLLDLNREANIINAGGALSQKRVMPGPLSKFEPEAEPEPEPVEKRRRGRPKGSRNKSTLEREAREALAPPKPKRAPGRPKGSKNKKTLEREAAMQETQVKRGPGRPKGSKNKKTLEQEAAVQRRGPGRPKGSGKKVLQEI